MSDVPDGPQHAGSSPHRDEAPVVWVSGAPQRDDATAALVEWARARGVKLAPLDEAASTVAASRIDLTIADRVEKDLDRARDAIGATDADATERALARVDALLREHPELPQAAWLRAEVERAWSQRWLRIEPRDEARARTAWENAHALDGGRVAGVGETSFPSRAKVKTTIVVDGTGTNTSAALLLDGVRIEPTTIARTNATYAIEIEPAEHQLVAQVDGRVAFASWVAIAATTGTAPINITVAAGGSCSRDQLAGVEIQDGKAVVAKDVTCPTWIAATPGAKTGTVLVARCERDACGPLLEWRVERLSGGMAGPPQKLDKRSTWPAWATWTLLGIGAATATSVALVATGVFESRPVEQRFVIGGARQE